MEPIILNDSQQILKLLNGIRLTGGGFCTECLLENLLDAGSTSRTISMPTVKIPLASIKANPLPGRCTKSVNGSASARFTGR